MEKDFSRILYDKYCGLINRNIEVTLKSGIVFQGVIIGFYKDNYHNPSITKWHIVDEKDKNSLGINAFSISIGKIVNQKDIAEVKFFEDNTILKFTQ